MATEIRDLMTTNIVCLGEDTPLREAARKMRDSNIGDVLVQDGSGKLTGIVTDRDIVVRAIAEGMDCDTTKLGQVATGKLTTLKADAGVDEAVKCMEDDAIRRIPVVEDGKPIGIVSIGDLAQERDRESALGQISAAPPNN